jgi:hypothetical protein
MAHVFVPPQRKLKLKEKGWFAAGEGFRDALSQLSDGAFRLFAYISIEANRYTGVLEGTYKELAAATGKSNRVIGCYVEELQRAKICTVRHGRNQHARSSFEICDRYWPYERVQRLGLPEGPGCQSYVDAICETYLSLGCVTGGFGPTNVRMAEDLHRHSIPLAVVQQALLLAACRKYDSWIQGSVSEPIRSLAYFSSTIAEVQKQPFAPGYHGYLRRKIRQLAQIWKESNIPASKPDFHKLPRAGAKK